MKRDLNAAIAKARIEREELLRRSAKAEESGKVEKAVELQQRAQEVVQEKPAYAPAQAKGVSFGEKWEFIVLDADKVPREFLMVDSLKIGQLVRAMKADAQKVLGDGVRVYSTPMVRASSR